MFIDYLVHELSKFMTVHDQLESMNKVTVHEQNEFMNFHESLICCSRIFMNSHSFLLTNIHELFKNVHEQFIGLCCQPPPQH